MESNAHIIEKEFNLLRDELIDLYDKKGMRASGKWARELEVRVQNNLGALYGLEYSQQLEYGRKAGGFPPIDAIEQWIFDKGLDARIEGNITTRSLAFLIARKISREGWNRDGDVNLISEVITPQRIDKIIDKVGEFTVLNLTSEIIELVANLNVN